MPAPYGVEQVEKLRYFKSRRDIDHFHGRPDNIHRCQHQFSLSITSRITDCRSRFKVMIKKACTSIVLSKRMPLFEKTTRMTWSKAWWRYKFQPRALKYHPPSTPCLDGIYRGERKENFSLFGCPFLMEENYSPTSLPKSIFLSYQFEIIKRFI